MNVASALPVYQSSVPLEALVVHFIYGVAQATVMIDELLMPRTAEETIPQQYRTARRKPLRPR